MSGIFAGLLAASAIEQVFVEDVFSTYLYTGNSSTQTITNGINLSGQGGLVWRQGRSAGTGGFFTDTARGIASYLISSSTGAATTGTNWIDSFNSNGFTMNVNSLNGGATYASWTFREAPNFFDVVTYTGDGVAGRQIAHNLGVAPGMITAKATSTTSNWAVWHRYNGTDNAVGFMLNATAAPAAVGPYSGGTSTYFNVDNVTDNNFNSFNQNGVQYVAYLFVHDTSSTGLIQCGSYAGTGLAGQIATLGWEPQWVMIKATNTTTGWHMYDTMRGMTTLSDGSARLFANTSGAESAPLGGSSSVFPTATGFGAGGGIEGVNQAGGNYIYMAIRRGPMRTPTLGTSVFYPQTVAQANSVDSSGVPFPPDLVNTFSRDGTDRTSVYDNFLFVDRLRSLGVPSDTYSGGTAGRALVSSSTAAELSGSDGYVQLKADSRNITRGPGWNDTLYGNLIYYFFRRAPSFMDVVCYTGTGVSQPIKHNLNAVPEIVIGKRRNATTDWTVLYPTSPIDLNYLVLNKTDAAAGWGSNLFTTTECSNIGSGLGETYVFYLFASAPGVSKVGSYTGNGSSQTINCAFTTGARFVLIKRTDSTGAWYVWDSARGIVAGNDPYLALNSTAAEVTSNDSVDADSTGFVVNQVAASNINVNAATYIFLAIA